MFFILLKKGVQVLLEGLQFNVHTRAGKFNMNTTIARSVPGKNKFTASSHVIGTFFIN